MCVVTEVHKIHKLRNKDLMPHEEVTLGTKKTPISPDVHGSGPYVPKSSLKRSSPSSGKRKSVRFAPDTDQRTRGCCPEAAEDFVLVTHQDAATDQPNPQEDESTRPVLFEICCLLTPSSEMSMREKSHIWWQARDYEVFKGTARLISSEIRRRTEASSNARGSSRGTEGYASVLTRSLDSCRLTPLPSHSEDENIDLSHPLPRRLFAYLTHWVRVGHSRRGLERWSVSSHSDSRNAARQDAIRTVLVEQNQEGEAEDERAGTGDGTDGMAERLRRVSIRATRSARLFARAIGQADAAAIGSGIYDPTLCCIVKTPVPPADLENSPGSVVPMAKTMIA